MNKEQRTKNKVGFKCYLDDKEVAGRALPLNIEENFSVFESLRIYKGKIFRLEQHVNRLIESARACGLELPLSVVLCPLFKKAVKHHKKVNGFLRATLWDNKLYVMIGSRKHSSEIYQTGVDLKTSSFRMPSPKATDVQAKTGNYRLQILATEYRGSRPEGQPFEYLFLDENHFLTEARVGNFCIVKKGALLTPPARSVLRGITLEVVLECARQSGLAVSETPLTRHDFFNADEAFLTNTSWEILPVRSLDGRTLRAKVPGPVTTKLIQSFYRKVQLECRPPQKIKAAKLSAPLSRSRIKKV